MMFERSTNKIDNGCQFKKKKNQIEISFLVAATNVHNMHKGNL